MEGDEVLQIGRPFPPCHRLTWPAILPERVPPDSLVTKEPNLCCLLLPRGAWELGPQGED